MDTSIGGGGGGREGGRRQLCVRKATLGANASWPYRENRHGPVSPLSWLPTCLQCRGCCKELMRVRSPKTSGGEGTHTAS